MGRYWQFELVHLCNSTDISFYIYCLFHNSKTIKRHHHHYHFNIVHLAKSNAYPHLYFSDITIINIVHDVSSTMELVYANTESNTHLARQKCIRSIHSSANSDESPKRHSHFGKHLSLFQSMHRNYIHHNVCLSKNYRLDRFQAQNLTINIKICARPSNILPDNVGRFL